MSKVNQLGNYKGIEVKVTSRQVLDEDVEKEIQHLLSQKSQLVEKEGTVENGDVTTIDFKGLKDGVAFDGGTAEGYQLEIGSGSFIPGFEEQMIGMKKGETRDLNLTFPENYGVADLAGADVIFQVTVHHIASKVQAQLDEEFSRLRGWFHKNLNESLPRHINDRNTQAALQIFNAYEGYNPDEINELAEKSQLTFVGDFAKHSENFKETSGYLNVVRYPNDKFTVFQDKEGTNEKLPYILVTHIPEHSDCFASWADEFKWDEKLCKTLLPDFRFREVSEVALRPLQKEGENKKSFFIRQFCGVSDEEAEADQRFLTAKLSTMTMPRMHKEALQKEIDSIVESNRRMREAANRPIGDVDEIEEPDPQELYNNHVSKLHYFTIGIVCDGGIKWLLATANLYNRKYSEFHYNIEKYRCDLKEVIDIKLWFSYSNTIGRKEYFGRGELNSSLADKRIAIIGLGAIGSPMAEALARGGVRQLTLWDGDIVEAGNICRSIYDNADIGNAKAQALAAHIKRISPFCDVI